MGRKHSKISMTLFLWQKEILIGVQRTTQPQFQPILEVSLSQILALTPCRVSLVFQAKTMTR